jgi:hypothetical protein
MGWGRIDGGFVGHPKRKRVSLAADGLLMRAISYSAEYKTDGYIEASFVAAQFVTAKTPARQRKGILDEVVRHRILEPLKAGEKRAVTAPAVPGLRPHAITVEVGPFDEPGYLIHDYLHCNPARAEVEERRDRDRAKKADQRQRNRQAVLPWDGNVPEGQPSLSQGVSPSRGTPGMGKGSKDSSERGSRAARARGRRRRFVAPSASHTADWVREHVPDLPESEAVRVVAEAWNQGREVTPAEVRGAVSA